MYVTIPNLEGILLFESPTRHHPHLESCREHGETKYKMNDAKTIWPCWSKRSPVPGSPPWTGPLVGRPSPLIVSLLWTLGGSMNDIPKLRGTSRCILKSSRLSWVMTWRLPRNPGKSPQCYTVVTNISDGSHMCWYVTDKGTGPSTYSSLTLGPLGCSLGMHVLTCIF